MKPRVIVAGGSGFVGHALAPILLAHDYEVVILTREPSSRHGDVLYQQWDGQTPGSWTQFVDGAKAIVNLTGHSINCRHTPENERAIIESRVNSVRVLGDAIAFCAQPPKVFIQASGVGIYGDQGDRWCDENAPHRNDFPAKVCELWEGAFAKITAPQTRKVVLRLGVVLGPNGGFLELLGKLTRWFLGGQVGDGRQFISWIHVADLNRMFVRALEDAEIAGVFNAVAPGPVSNAEFMREMRRALRRPWSPPVPEFAARLGGSIMGTEASLALVSQRCTPKHFLEKDFRFDFPELRTALHNIYSKP
jgi:uncharacterized protein (TIGR01777 family)